MLLSHVLRILPAIIAAVAGYTDWRSRRIPNWLTLPSLALGIVLNSILAGWAGTKDSLLGAGLGLALLLPFVIIRALGAGDWKLVGALGAFLGPNQFVMVLVLTILINGLMALAMIVWKRRLGQTIHNFGRMMAALASLHLPGPDLTLDNPEAVKVPFGIAVAVAMVVYTVSRIWVRV